MKDKQILLNSIRPENLKINIGQKPFKQSQNKSWSIKNASYNDYNLFICYGGIAEFNIEKNKYLLKPGFGLLVPPKTTLNAKLISNQNFDAIAQHFNLYIFENVNFFKFINYNCLIKFSNFDFVKNTIQYYDNIYTKKHILRYNLFFSILSEFLYDSFISIKENRNDKYFLIIKILNYINNNLYENNILDKSLSFSSYGQDYTSKIFKKYVGISPKKYILKKKINNSKDLLINNLPINEVANQSGFEDQFYFNRIFKKYTGTSPGKFRDMYQN